MSETKKMIEIINQNKSNKHEIKNQILVQKKARAEKISNVFTIVGYLIATYAFVQIVTILVK